MTLDDIINSVNIAEDLDEQKLNEIGAAVLEGYQIDKRSREGWEGKLDEWTELALQAEENKTFPWPNAANVKYPLVTTAALQFSSRAYPALVPSSGAVRGRTIGFDPSGQKQSRAIRIGKHMSWQLSEQMESWEEDMDKLLFALPIIGTMFKKTYYDGSKRHNVSEIVYPKELVVNYWTSCLEDAPRVTHELRMSQNDIYERKMAGLYLDVELEKPYMGEEEKVSEMVSGTVNASPSDDVSMPYIIYEQHTYYDLDDDGYAEPYIITIDSTSGKVLRMVARFEKEDVEYTEDGEILKIKPMNFFTKFTFVPAPDGGFYDIGFGVLLGPINETINTAINQMLDSGTLSNLQSGFIARGIRIKGGNKEFEPGEWKYVNSTGDDLRKSIVPLPVREPSSVLFNLLQLMITAGERLSSVTEIMTGDIPGQNTKATVAMNAVEQSMKVFTAIHKRCHRSLKSEYKKLFELNSLYMEDQEYFTVLDAGQEQGQIVAKGDYNSGDFDVVPASDPNVATEQQRMQKLGVVGQMLQLGTINPAVYTKMVLEYSEVPNVEQLMQMPPRQPSLEEIQFQHEAQMDMQRLEMEKLKNEYDGILALAKAEQAETGQQLDAYKAKLETLKTQKEIVNNANRSDKRAVR